jgi:hypothetical protein
MRAAIRVTLALGLICFCACADTKKGAADEFSKDFSCPADKITVKPRDDLKIHDITFGPRPAPPSDVAKDPQRLAIWNAKEQKNEDSWNNSGNVYEVSGCDHDLVYTCSQAQTHASTSSGIICSEASHLPDAGSKK